MEDTPTIDWMKQKAQQCHAAIAGSLAIQHEGNYYNRFYFVKPDGEVVTYNKRHLFTFGGEDKTFTKGEERVIVSYQGIRFLLQICYDLRFPVFCRNVKNNYDILIVVANWPRSREYAWRQLLIARALENECYVIGANRCGTDPQGVDYGEGSSIVVDFKGKIIGQRMTSPIITTELNPAQLVQFREKFPAWRDADEFSL